MMDTELKPDSRAARFVGFTITALPHKVWVVGVANRGF